VTMQWIRDSLNAGKPLSLSRRVDTVLYRPLPYPLPVPAFRSQVGMRVASCGVVVAADAHDNRRQTCNDTHGTHGCVHGQSRHPH